MVEILLSSLALTLALSPVLLTVLAIANRSWIAMWFAALGSLVISYPAMLSFGLLVFLLFCLQAPAALALRRHASRREWVLFLSFGALTWVATVPGLVLIQTGLGWYYADWLYVSPFVGLFGLLLPFLPIGRPHAQPS